MIDLSTIGFQVALPVVLLIWLSRTPAKSLLLYCVRDCAIALYLIALCLVPIWLVLPWWTPWVYLVAGITIVADQVRRRVVSMQPRLPTTRSQWVVVVLVGLVATALAVLNLRAVSGRIVPDATVDLAFPMGPGTYLVANGGSTQTINGHFKTLQPKTQRQRAYHGQSYAVDLVKLGRFGARAPGWRPRDPAAYAIFGEPVLAPCSGEVLAANDGMPDMPVPDMDTSLLEGNHVFIDCGGYGVLLAHFRQASLRVTIGDVVDTGHPLGEAGNSGQSAEPHLHVHAQRIPTAGPLLSGEPLFITFDGRFVVRNERITIAATR